MEIIQIIEIIETLRTQYRHAFRRCKLFCRVVVVEVVVEVVEVVMGRWETWKPYKSYEARVKRSPCYVILGVRTSSS